MPTPPSPLRQVVTSNSLTPVEEEEVKEEKDSEHEEDPLHQFVDYEFRAGATNEARIFIYRRRIFCTLQFPLKF